MKYYVIAGERSGDLHAGNLIKAISSMDEKAMVRGFGGDYMTEVGAEIVVHYEKLAFMGFLEVVKNYSTIKTYLEQCKIDILSFNPDVLILVDYAGFNLRIAKFAKEQGIRVFYYISPKVWAWNQKRAYKIKKRVDEMFTILPFEPEFYKKFEWDVKYVGNPVLDAVKSYKPDPDFKSSLNIADDKSVIALLPGSRKQELASVLPLMTEICASRKNDHFVVAAVKHLTPLYGAISKLENVSLVFDKTYDLLSCANCAVVTSGTATLETALWNVPQVVVYKTSWITYKIARSLIKVDYISLVNLIADKLVVKELIQEDFNLTNLSGEIELLLNEGNYRDEMLAEYAKIRQVLGEGTASKKAAELMLAALPND
ncbi:MAG: lipid-A-disaccharide synthase [Bacteroidota bacterium]